MREHIIGTLDEGPLVLQILMYVHSKERSSEAKRLANFKCVIDELLLCRRGKNTACYRTLLEECFSRCSNRYLEEMPRQRMAMVTKLNPLHALHSRLINITTSGLVNQTQTMVDLNELGEAEYKNECSLQFCGYLHVCKNLNPKKIQYFLETGAQFVDLKLTARM